jgi:hypothetical protein
MTQCELLRAGFWETVAFAGELKGALLAHTLDRCVFETASAGPWNSDAVPLPESEPRILGVHLIVPLVCGFTVGQMQRPSVCKRVDALQPLYFGDGLLCIHGLDQL